MRKKEFLYVFVVLLLTVSCRKVIDLEVNETEPKMVIEANYDAVKEEVLVKISKSINVFAAENYPAITGAEVQIIDENNVATSLVDQGDGTYLVENYTPIYNSSYKMVIEADGTTYKASDSLPSIVSLDSIEPEFQEENLFIDSGYVLFINLTDPLGPNYYRVIRNENGEYADEAGDLFLFDDGLTEGNAQRVPLFANLYQPGDSISIELISYSEHSFKYYQLLSDIANGSAQSAAPANPTYSWTNKALGHFATYGYDTKYIVIEE